MGVRLLSIIFTLLLFSSCSKLSPESFQDAPCIMIVPDIQNYTSQNENLIYLDAISNYYINNPTKFDACFQVGDITNNNQSWQYNNAYIHFFRKFKNESKLIHCLGNHDYGTNGSSDIRYSNYPDSLMPTYDIRMTNSSYENYVKYITIGEEKYGVLVLEFATRNEVLDWADSIINSTPDIPYIILTHVFLNSLGEMYDYTNSDVLQRGSHKTFLMDNEYKNDSNEIFNKIIFNNTNVKLVICGHSLTPNYIEVLSKDNIEGNKIHIIMVNYQHYINGGDGYVAILQILKESYRICSFSTINHKYGEIDIIFDSNGIYYN